MNTAMFSKLNKLNLRPEIYTYMRASILIITSLLFLFNSCKPRYDAAITQDDLMSSMEFLAGDELKGRYPGTPEDSLLLNYIASQFKLYRLEKFDGSYIHKFNFLSKVEPDPENSIRVKDKIHQQGIDFMPYVFSGDTDTTLEIVFCGYGYEIMEGKVHYSDYHQADVKNKWVMVLRGEPDNRPEFRKYSSARDKAILAMDKGALGILLVSPESFSPNDALIEPGRKSGKISIPAIHIKRSLANDILKESDLDIIQLTELSKASETGYSVKIKGETSISVSMNNIYTSTGNVAGMIKGTDPELKNEWVIIGAHHDHLGFGGQGSSSRRPDTLAIHYGADDNASGVASVLELAAYFSAPENHPKRSLLFVTFGAEEMGLLGSADFTSDYNDKMGNISAMINIDMLGRMKEDSVLQISGVGTAKELNDIILTVEEETGNKLNLKLSKAGYGPSDHASFYKNNVPVLFFTTGIHGDYHTPDDNLGKINYPGLETGDEFIAEIIDDIANLDSALSYTEAGPKTSNTKYSRNKVTMGIMPDVTGSGDDGLAVLGVTAGRPAAIGGMQKGDVIVAIEGKEISDIYSYMHRLNAFKPGQHIVVTVKRNDELLDLLIQL